MSILEELDKQTAHLMPIMMTRAKLSNLEFGHLPLGRVAKSTGACMGGFSLSRVAKKRKTQEILDLKNKKSQ